MNRGFWFPKATTPPPPAPPAPPLPPSLRLADAERDAISEVVDCLTETGTALANPTATRNTLAALLARLA